MYSHLVDYFPEYDGMESNLVVNEMCFVKRRSLVGRYLQNFYSSFTYALQLQGLYKSSSSSLSIIS
jgi:hypothetical protein